MLTKWVNGIKKYKQTHRYRKQTDSCQRGGGIWGTGVEKVKGLRSTHW